MRGLPGSGKSTIVNLIKSSFDPSRLVVCSADDFFTDRDGNYNFNEKLLGAAHTECQRKAKLACETNTSVVVIDNTNVRRWEMKFYLNLGTTFGYVAILAEPKTPWSKDPAELAVRNTHNVPLEALQRKVKTFEDMIPSYYGWFCNEEKSTSLLRLSSQLLRECLLKLPEFRHDLMATVGIRGRMFDDETTAGMLAKHYIRHDRSGPLLHCTAKFCGRGRVPRSASYHQREDVRAGCGQVFQISVPGLVFTRRTMGARVTLGAKAAPLFCKPEEREWRSPVKASASTPSPKVAEAGSLSAKKKGGKQTPTKAERKLQEKERKAKRRVCYDDDDDEEDGEDEDAEERENERINDRSLVWGDTQYRKTPAAGGARGFSHCYENSLSEAFSAQLVLNSTPSKPRSVRGERGSVATNSGKSSLGSPKTQSLSELFPGVLFEGEARSAHLTLRTAQGVEAREVNFDLLHTCDIEQELIRSGQAVSLVPVSQGRAVYHGDGICCVYFNKPFTLETIFSGFY